MAMVSSCLGMRGVGNYLPTASISFGAGSTCAALSDDESPEMADQIGAGVCWHLTIILYIILLQSNSFPAKLFVQFVQHVSSPVPPNCLLKLPLRFFHNTAVSMLPYEVC